ncbi:hypothetical protein [Streptomyces sp. NPDC095613]|uniref:hypothetical protein n=1 Tax=Streptomyces sp. NPDC095613 TaxID=3155540 RepID=UPI00331ABC6C
MSYDWSALRCFAGSAAGLPAAVRDLLSAATGATAEEAYWRIDGVALVQGRLSESCMAVCAVLVNGLPGATEHGRRQALDLLAQISGGYEEHVDSAAVGPVSYAACMREIVRGFPLYRERVETDLDASCVDLVLMCGLADERLRDAAVRVLERALDAASDRDVRELIANSLGDLRGEASGA